MTSSINNNINDFPPLNSEDMKKLEATLINRLYESEEIPEYDASKVKPFKVKKKKAK